jgi:hypothetical protein
MRRILLVVVALLFLSTLAFADSIEFQGSGVLGVNAHTVGSVRAGSIFGVTNELMLIDDLTTGKIQTGNLGTFSLVTGSLFKCASGLCFDGGKLDLDRLNGSDYFVHALSEGTISMANGSTTITAQLTNGSAAVLRLGPNFSSQALVRTHVAVIPEPATLALLGTGLLGMGLLKRSMLLGGGTGSGGR